MASRKRTPETSRIARASTVAYSRKQKSSSDDTVEDSPVEPAKSSEAKAAEPTKPERGPEPGIDPKTQALAAKRADTEPTDETPRSRAATEAEPPTPEVAPWPDATPVPMKPVETTPRTHADTVAMPAQTSIGAPPEMPTAVAPPPDVSAIEQPTRMPGPREIPPGNPEDPAAPPGVVPRGDSRSLRRNNEFALIYRIQNSVISRSGVVGTRGQWRVVEYPTSTSAAHAYAKECSRFVSEGFSDYRE